MKERPNRLYELRRERKLSQLAVGMALHISQSSVSDYEKGKKPIPSDTLFLFSDFYGVSAEYIMRKSERQTAYHFENLTEDENGLLTFYRRLREDYRRLFDNIVLAFKTFIDGKH